MVGAPLATTNAAIEIKRIWDMDTVAAQEHPAVQVHPRHYGKLTSASSEFQTGIHTLKCTHKQPRAPI